jgi:hypothetical protein
MYRILITSKIVGNTADPGGFPRPFLKVAIAAK